jgi:hypothetical protein
MLCVLRSVGVALRASGSADQSRSALANGRTTSVGYSRLSQQNLPIGDIERKEVAQPRLNFWRTQRSSARRFLWIQRHPAKRAVSTCRCRSFGRTAPWDFYHPLQEIDSAGPVSDHRRAADPASGPTVDLAGQADSGLSMAFPFVERPYNGSQFEFVPDKEKCRSLCRNYRSLTYSDSLIYIFLSSGTARRRSNLIRQQTPGVPISSYEHTRTARRTSGNP